MQLLLVEDDRDLAAALKTALQRQGYVVNGLFEGRAVVDLVKSEQPDLLILDLGLPDLDGLEVLRRLRSSGCTLPVLILTARADIEQRVLGLDSGADDYLTKPFEMSELLARLRVLERRLTGNHSIILSCGDITLDINNLHVMLGGRPLDLSKKERMVLKVLLEGGGNIVTRRKLEDTLYRWGEEVSSNAIEVHIHHLRKKLGSERIATVRGLGYRILS